MPLASSGYVARAKGIGVHQSISICSQEVEYADLGATALLVDIQCFEGRGDERAARSSAAAVRKKACLTSAVSEYDWLAETARAAGCHIQVEIKSAERRAIAAYYTATAISI